MKNFVSQYGKKNISLRILEVGSQDINGSYRPLFDYPKWRYYGMDIQKGRNVDIFVKNPYNWREIKSNFYDIVISGQTLEHTEFFWVTMLEISRVLKNGGLCCIIVPSSGPEHKHPLDCWRFFPDGLNAIANYAHLEVIKKYTSWEDKSQKNEWKDSVLICKKIKRGVIQKIRFFVKNKLSSLIIYI